MSLATLFLVMGIFYGSMIGAAILCFFFDEIAREFRHIRYLRRKKKERKRALREAKRRTPA